ncbi:MAG TPA: hypothetical protein DHV67_00605 [Gallionella sp.]|nr:hypothetical protein [Gallionella sp.]
MQAALEKQLDAHTTVLVKGSRFMKMERVVAYCVEADKGEGGSKKEGGATGFSPSSLAFFPSLIKENH